MPEGTPEDDTDQDGGLPDEADDLDDDADIVSTCPTVSDILRSRQESID